MSENSKVCELLIGSDKFQELVLTSFRNLTKVKSEGGQTGMQTFEAKFYGFFFERNPAAQRLFDSNDIGRQSKAFVR